MGDRRIATAAKKDFEDYIYYCGCSQDGKFLGRNDGCCVYENKDVGCTFHNICKALSLSNGGQQ